ncbi:MAG: glycyl-radical enzyme activating protein [Bacillota bacterium]
MKSPLIVDIKSNSWDDGRGIRSVVFFKGCPLNCVWCHNPESRKPQAEVMYNSELCIGCGSCERKCSQQAIGFNKPGFIDRTNCNYCFDCIRECPSTALKRVGIEMSPDEIINRVLRDKPFLVNSSGGVTFSGGEPTLHLEFLSLLLKAFREEGIHTLVETCGFFNFEPFSTKILPYTDAVYMDIKLFDAKAHEKYCGVKNDIILENFTKLAELSAIGRFELLPRTPLVPGITDTSDNLTAIAGFLAANKVKQAKLLEYNPLWLKKAGQLGLPNCQGLLETPQSVDQVQKCKKVFIDYGITV